MIRTVLAGLAYVLSVRSAAGQTVASGDRCLTDEFLLAQGITPSLKRPEDLDSRPEGLRLISLDWASQNYMTVLCDIILREAMGYATTMYSSSGSSSWITLMAEQRERDIGVEVWGYAENQLTDYSRQGVVDMVGTIGYDGLSGVYGGAYMEDSAWQAAYFSDSGNAAWDSSGGSDIKEDFYPFYWEELKNHASLYQDAGVFDLKSYMFTTYADFMAAATVDESDATLSGTDILGDAWSMTRTNSASLNSVDYNWPDPADRDADADQFIPPQCDTATKRTNGCFPLIAAKSNWDVNISQYQILNLELPMWVEWWMNGASATSSSWPNPYFDVVSLLLLQKKPFFFVWWEPDAWSSNMVADGTIKRLQFPPSTGTCWKDYSTETTLTGMSVDETDSSVACDYGGQDLWKLVLVDTFTKRVNIDALNFVKNLDVRSDVITEMFVLASANPSWDNNQIVCNWLQNNPDEWKDWVENTYDPPIWLYMSTVGAQGKAFACFAVIGLICLLNVGGSFFYGDRKILRMASYQMNGLAVFGLVLCNFSVVLWTYDEETTSDEDMIGMCIARNFMFTLGFSLFIGCIGSKLYRVKQIFNKMKMVSVGNKQLVIYTMGWVVFTVGYFLISTLSGTTNRVIYVSPPIYQSNGSTVVEQFGYCETVSFDSGGGILAINTIAIIIVTTWAWETRNVFFAAANDSRQIAYIVFSVVLGFLFIVMMYYTMLEDRPAPDPTKFFAVMEAVVFFITFVTVALMYFPKFYAIFSGSEAEWTTDSRAATKVVSSADE